MSEKTVPQQHEPAVVALVGPTATGKTDLAVRLVERFPFEIISVDSAMVYRHMDVGTAKPGPDVLSVAPHRLIDIREPWERYSAGEFCADALRSISEIRESGRVPLLVGGTLLYVRALQYGLAELPAADMALRSALDARGETEGWPALHAELARVDPVAAGRIAAGDRQRIQRALEVFSLTGEPISELQRVDKPGVGSRQSEMAFLRIALVPGERAALHKRIEARFAQMMAGGFLAEVESLRGMPGMSAESPAMRAVGYRQLWAHLDGAADLATATRDAITATRRMAKRQLTWLRADADELAFDCLDPMLDARVAETIEARANAIFQAAHS
jgi:tRNA dimethylallyltransferase